MDLYAVMGEVGNALKTITGLRVAAWGAKTINVPAAVVALPDEILFDQTYGRGSDKISDLLVFVMVGDARRDDAVKTLAAYCAGSGAKSVKAKVEAYAYTTAHTVVVTKCLFPDVTFAGAPYLAAEFHLDIIGLGA